MFCLNTTVVPDTFVSFLHRKVGMYCKHLEFTLPTDSYTEGTAYDRSLFAGEGALIALPRRIFLMAQYDCFLP